MLCVNCSSNFVTFIKCVLAYNLCRYLRAPDERPYGIVRTITMLRSGIICFWTLQAIYTNWERRLAVRASNERPYRFHTKQKCIRALFGSLMHFIYLTVFSNYGRWYTTNLNFQFPILHFQFINWERWHTVI